MKKLISTLALLSLAAGATAAPPTEKFQRHFASFLKDPDSLKFQVTLRSGDKVCGRYNAKNSYGGYTGYKPFVYVPSEDVLYAGYTIITKNLLAYEPSDLIEGAEFEELTKRMDMAAEATSRIDAAHKGCPDA